MKTRRFTPQDFELITNMLAEAIREESIGIDIIDTSHVVRVTIKFKWYGMWIPLRSQILDPKISS